MTLRELSETNGHSVVGDFDALADQMRGRLRELELRASSRTRDLQAAADVAKQTATLLNLDELLPQVVELTKERFNLYHAHIYLLDSLSQELVLAAGAGEPGRQMVAFGHTIDLSLRDSIVARTGRDRQPQVVNDVASTPGFLPNALLPNTKSEMGVPMVIGDRLIGVLDVQSDEVNHFTDDDILIMTSLGDQIAVAVENARAFEQTQVSRQDAEFAQAEAELLYKISEKINQAITPDDMLQSVADYAGTRGARNLLMLYFDRYEGEYPETMEVVASQGLGAEPPIPVGTRFPIESYPFSQLMFSSPNAPILVSDVANDDIMDAGTRETYTALNIAANALLPLYMRGQWIGIVSILWSEPYAFTEQDGRIFASLARQTATAVDLTRQFEQTQDALAELQRQEELTGRRAAELETVVQVSAAASTILDVDELLYTVADLTKDRFGLYHAHVYLLSDDGKTLRLTAGAGETGRRMVSRNHQIPVNREHSLVARCARTREPVIANDVRTEPDFLPNPELPGTRSELAVPMMVGGRLIGVLDVQADQASHFGPDEARIQGALASQVAVAVNNARLFQQTEARLRDVQISAQIAEYMRGDEPLEDTLEKTLEYVAQAIGADNAFFGNWDYEQDRMTGFVATGPNMTREFARSVVEPAQRLPHAVEAITTGQVVPVHNAATYPGFPMDYVEVVDMKSVLTVPIFTGSKTTGLIFFNYSTALHHFTPEEIALAHNIGNQLSLGIERKQSGEQIRVYADVVNNTPVGIYVWRLDDLDGDLNEFRVLMANEASRASTLRDPAEIVGKTVNETFPTLIDSPILSVYRDVILSRQVVDLGESEFVNDLGEFRTYSVKIFPLPGNTAGASFEDVTDRKRIADEVQERATEIEIISEIGAEIATNLNLDELLVSIANTVKERFKRYYAHIYTYDAQTRTLVLRAGAGEIGRQLVAKGHSIPLDHETSIVARAGRELEPVVIDDVSQSAHHLPNRLLPDTRSELAMPIISGNELLGVLDIQDDKPDSFSAVQVQAKTVLAHQIAVAMQNAAAFDEIQRATEALAVSETQSREIAEDRDRLYGTSIDLLGSAGFDGYFKGLNPAWESVLGWTTEELMGKPYIEFVHPDDVEPTNREANEQLARGLKTISFSNRYVTKAGDYRWLSWNSTPDMASGLIYFVVRDVTQQRELLAQIERRASELATVAEVSAATTTITDVDTLLKRVSDLTKDRFDLYHAHVYLLDETGQSLLLSGGAGMPGELMKSEGHLIPLTRENSIVARAGRSMEGVISNDVTADAFHLPNPLLPETRSELAVPLIVSGRLIGVLDVQSKLASRFKAEDLLIMRTLADQVAVAVENARRFAETQRQAERERETAERLREVDRLKSQFLANMSHELRTPLNSIIGYSEVLLDGVDGNLEEEAMEDVNAIHSSGKHLLAIINEILDLAKIEARQMQLDLESIELAKLIQEIVRSGQILTKDKPVVIELIEENAVGMINADKIRLRQIIWNLLSNAVKFTEQGSVKVCYGRVDDDMAYVKVVDTGVGIASDKLHTVFERFSQVDGSSTRRAGGTGLGLTITQQLVHMHGGEIEVESEFGVGSIFSFTIPLYKEAQLA